MFQFFVVQVMTKDLVTAVDGCTLAEANKIMQESKVVHLSVL
jgi:CBS domain-containing protein